MTITDTFNRANNASVLGTTSDGSATWSTLAGTFGILTNQAYQSGGGGGAKLAVLDVGATTGTEQVTIAAVEGGTGVVFRVVDATNFYLWNLGSDGKLYDVTAGTFTVVTTVGLVTAGQVVQVILHATTADFVVAGTTGASGVSIPNRSTATKVGIYNGSGAGTHASRYDDFSFTPSAAPAARIWRPAVRSQAIPRASVI